MSEATRTNTHGHRAGGRYEHRPDKPGYRWGQAKAQVGFHGGKIEVDRPRVRNKATGKEMTLPSWEEIAAGGYSRSVIPCNLMVMNVATRQFGRADVACRKPGFRHKLAAGFQSLRSHVSFKALTQAYFNDWMGYLNQVRARHHCDPDRRTASGRSPIDDRRAVGIERFGGKHPLGVIEGATENTATVQERLDNLIERGLDPEGCYLFIVDGAKALTKAIRRIFGADIPIQCCHASTMARNITDRHRPEALTQLCDEALKQACGTAIDGRQG